MSISAPRWAIERFARGLVEITGDAMILVLEIMDGNGDVQAETEKEMALRVYMIYG